jgi:hypothetical protein
MKEVLGAKIWIWKVLGASLEISRALVNWFQNLEQGEGLMCKIGWMRADLQLEFENQGLKWKNLENLGLWVDLGKAEGHK